MEKTRLLKAHTDDVLFPDRWKEKRKATLSIFLLSSFIQGVEFTSVFATLWSYVNKGLSRSDPNLSYGLIAGGRFLAPIVFGTIIGTWFDKKRSMKRLMVSTTLLMNVGYVLYTLHFSPYLPVMAAIIQGCSFILSAAIRSEALRVYRGDEVQRNMLFFLIAYGAGDTLGPLIVKPFENVDFRIGSLRITYGNIAAIFSLALNTIRLILVCFFVHDLSKEFDLKAHEALSTNSVDAPVSVPTLKQSFSFEAAFLLVQQAYTGFFTTFVGRTFPLVTSTLEYSNFVLCMCFSGASLLMTITAIILSAGKITSKGVYVCGIASLASLLLGHLVLFAISKELSEPIKIMLLSSLIFCYSMAWVTDQTFIVVTLGKLFPSSVQSSVEGMRMMVHLCGSFAASLASAYLYTYFQYLSCISIPMALLLLGTMFLRRAVFSHPTTL